MSRFVESHHDTLSSRLKSWRAEKGLTQREMAKRARQVGLKIEHSHIGAWETGTLVCGPRSARKLARLVGLKNGARQAFLYACARTMKGACVTEEAAEYPPPILNGLAYVLKKVGLQGRDLTEIWIDDCPRALCEDEDGGPGTFWRLGGETLDGDRFKVTIVVEVT